MNQKEIISFDSGGIRTHASEETGALNQRLRLLGHATSVLMSHGKKRHSPTIPCQLRNFFRPINMCLYSSVAERWSCKPKVMSSILIGGRSTCFAKRHNIYVGAKNV